MAVLPTDDRTGSVLMEPLRSCRRFRVTLVLTVGSFVVFNVLRLTV